MVVGPFQGGILLVEALDAILHGLAKNTAKLVRGHALEIGQSIGRSRSEDLCQCQGAGERHWKRKRMHLSCLPDAHDVQTAAILRNSPVEVCTQYLPHHVVGTIIDATKNGQEVMELRWK